VHTEITKIHNKLVLIAPFLLSFHVQIILFLWVCSTQILLGYEEGAADRLQYKLVDFDQDSIPLIQYNCFKNFDPLTFGFSYTGDPVGDWFHIAEVDEVNTTLTTYISSVDAVLLNSALLSTASTELDGELKSLTFLDGKDEIFELFSKKTDHETAFLLNQSTIAVEDFPNSHTENIGHEGKNSQTKFDYTIIVIILILALVIYFAAYFSPSIIYKSSLFGILARRKRWLRKLLSSGKVDAKTYDFLLRQIDDLPRWIRAKEFAHLDLPTAGADPELEVALRRRKSGESVVKTKETSLERTSR